MRARAIALAFLLGVIMSMSATTHADDTAMPARCRALNDAGPQTGRRDGRVVYCPHGPDRDLPYYLHLPHRATDASGVLVAVHGISRNAREQVHAFGARAARLGLVTVAPLFTRERFPGYQRLGHSRRGVASFPHVALQNILEEVADATGADTARSFLFGFSGGAQFAHRYAMRYPDRVRAIALGSAGWYTFPDVGQPFPRGLGATPLAQGIDPVRFLHVPALVLVGENDDRRDRSLNTSRAIDLQQGRDRIERARRWTGAMRTLASRTGVDARLDMEVMPRCGHDFTDCVRGGGLVERVLDFFATATRRAPAPERERDAGPLMFTAGR